jgi:hypothetical protein
MKKKPTHTYFPLAAFGETIPHVLSKALNMSFDPFVCTPLLRIYCFFAFLISNDIMYGEHVNIDSILLSLGVELPAPCSRSPWT